MVIGWIGGPNNIIFTSRIFLVRNATVRDL